jgi:hypothetical protein
MRSILLLFLLPMASVGHAAHYCVASDAGFRSALASAALSPEADEIRLVRKTIPLQDNIYASVKIAGDLQLRGGYASDCNSRLDPTHVTRIDGAGWNIALQLRRDADLDIEQLHFHGLYWLRIEDNLADTEGPHGEVRISRSAFREFGMGPHIGLMRHHARISNSLFAENDTGVSYHSPQNSSGSRPPTLEVANSTLANNDVGLWVLAGPGGSADLLPSIVNSIVADNLHADLLLEQPTIVRYSIYRQLVVDLTGALHPKSGFNLSSAPKLDAKYVPRADSPALDSGDDGALEFPTTTDFAMRPRKVGAHVDRGALERQGGLGFPFP